MWGSTKEESSSRPAQAKKQDAVSKIAKAKKGLEVEVWHKQWN
jgi:hypothetical protein